MDVHKSEELQPPNSQDIKNAPLNAGVGPNMVPRDFWSIIVNPRQFYKTYISIFI